jgi:hypothetical protein
MTWLERVRWVVPTTIFVGTSALTVAILMLPDLGLGILAALVGARVLMGIARWLVVFRVAGWWYSWGQQPQLAGAA